MDDKDKNNSNDTTNTNNEDKEHYSVVENNNGNLMDFQIREYKYEECYYVYDKGKNPLSETTTVGDNDKNRSNTENQKIRVQRSQN